MSNEMKLIMESWKELSKQVIKEDDTEGEVYQGDLDLMGAPLSPEERAESDRSYERKMLLASLDQVISDLLDKGYTLDQIRQVIDNKNEHKFPYII